MNWRRIGLLYVLAGLLAVEYWRLERIPPPPEPGDPSSTHPRLLDVDVKTIQRLRIIHGGRVLVAEHGADGWVASDPPDAPVASGLIDAFVTTLATAETIAQAGDGSSDPAAFGLDDRAVRIEILTSVGPPVVVLLGNLSPTGTTVYARRSGDPAIVVIGRNVAYYEDLIFQALPPAQVPAGIRDPVGG